MKHLVKVYLLFLTICHVYSQLPSASISPPLGFNASLGAGSTEFTCDVSRAEDIQWRVDGIPSRRDDVINQRGIETSDITTIDAATGEFRSTLTIPATEVNSNTTVQCIALHVDNGNSPSPTVVYLVQGLLAPPPGLEIADTLGSSFTRRLSWNAPETIDLTDIEPDIDGYIVCYTITAEQSSCETVSSLEFIFPNVRVALVFSVSALNEVGEGNASTVEHQACDGNTAPSSVRGEDVNSLLMFQDEPSLVLSFPQPLAEGEDMDCFNVYSVELLSSSNVSVSRGPFLPDVVEAQDGRTITIRVNSGLTPNTVYSATIITVNDNGETNSTGDIAFTTYDIQSVIVSAIPGGLSLGCGFAEGSLAQACSLTVCDGAGLQCQNVTISNTPSATTEIELALGGYSVSEVREIERDGAVTILVAGALEIEDVQVTELKPTPPPSTTTTTPGSPSSGPGGLTPGPGSNNITGSIIAGIIAGAIVVILVVTITIVFMCIVRHRRTHKPAEHDDHHQGSGVSYSQWQGDSDGGNGPLVTQSILFVETTDLNPTYEEPVRTIQRETGHHSVIRTSTDSPNDHHDNNSIQVRSATSPLYTDIMQSSDKVDLSADDTPGVPPKNLSHEDLVDIDHQAPDVPRQNLSTEDIRELNLTSSERSLTSESGKRKLSFDNLKSSQESLLSASSQTSMTGAHPTYAELEHHRSNKKQPNDKTGVFYSEIKVDEIPPVLPEKRVKKGPSLNGLPGTGQDQYV